MNVIINSYTCCLCCCCYLQFLSFTLLSQCTTLLMNFSKSVNNSCEWLVSKENKKSAKMLWPLYHITLPVVDMTSFYRMTTILTLASLGLGCQCCPIVDTDTTSLTFAVLCNQPLAIMMSNGRNITGSVVKPTDLWSCVQKSKQSLYVLRK